MTPAGTDDEHVVLTTFHHLGVVAEHPATLLIAAPERAFGVIESATIGHADFLRHLWVVRVSLDLEAFDRNCHGRLDAKAPHALPSNLTIGEIVNRTGLNPRLLLRVRPINMDYPTTIVYFQGVCCVAV